jgi:hypothetical protein
MAVFAVNIQIHLASLGRFSHQFRKVVVISALLATKGEIHLMT